MVSQGVAVPDWPIPGTGLTRVFSSDRIHRTTMKLIVEGTARVELK